MLLPFSYPFKNSNMPPIIDKILKIHNHMTCKHNPPLPPLKLNYVYICHSDQLINF